MDGVAGQDDQAEVTGRPAVPVDLEGELLASMKPHQGCLSGHGPELER
jgi:hypothetical protein